MHTKPVQTALLPTSKLHRWAPSIVLMLCLTCWVAPVHAEDAEGAEAKEIALALVQVMVEQGLLTAEQGAKLVALAQERVARARPGGEAVAASAAAAAGAAAAPGPAASSSVHVQYVPEIVKSELRENVRADVLTQARAEGWAIPGAVPDWTKRIGFEGDLRLRGQVDMFDDSNSTTLPDYQAINDAGTTDIAEPFLYTDNEGNVAPTRERLRVRARFGVNVQVSDSIDAGIRVATGNTGDPVTTNQTLGTYDGRYDVVFDRLWLRARLGEHVEISGGRIANPFTTTELFWHPELGFEGIAGTGRWSLGGGVEPFVTLGAFPLDEFSFTRDDKWLLGGQLGTRWAMRDTTNLRLSVGYYSYLNVTGRLNPTDLSTYDYTAPAYVQKGNTLFNIRTSSTDPNAALYALAGEYQLLNVGAALDIGGFGDNHVILSGDWVLNTGWDREEVALRSGQEITSEEDTGYLLKIAYGAAAPALKHDWQVFSTYKYLEADAAIDAFTETEMHLGGTNLKGFTLGGSYFIFDNSELTLRWLSADEITADRLGIDVVLADWKVEF